MKTAIILFFILMANNASAEFYVINTNRTNNDVKEAVIYLLQEKMCQIRYGTSCHGDNEDQYQKIIDLLNKLGGDTTIIPEDPQPE